MTALGAALAVSVLAPSLANGVVVGEVLNGVGNAVSGVAGGAGVADPRAGTPPNYTPPLHGTNPHGEGTVATVDTNPSNTNPYGSHPSQSGEDIVVGQSHGEQNGSTYHGRVTIAYVNLLGVIGPVEISRETNPGQTDTGPAGSLNTAIDTLIEAPSGNVVTLDVLSMNSSTSGTGSHNSFVLGRAGFTFAPAMGAGASASAGSSNGNIQESGGCQTATGSSSVADATVTGIPAVTPQAQVMPASSTSTACNNGQQSTTNDSSLATITGLPVGVTLPPGCNGPNETPDASFDVVPGVASFVCNADDVNQGQTGSPYGVREAFTPFVTLPAPLPTVRVAVSGPESHAVAPSATPTPTAGPGNPGGNQNPGGQGQGGVAGEEAGDAAGEAQPGGGSLPFTGQNLLLLGLIGGALISIGLLVMAARERQTV